VGVKRFLGFFSIKLQTHTNEHVFDICLDEVIFGAISHG